MKRMICVCLLSTLLFVACKKKEQSGTEVGKTANAAAKMAVSYCRRVQNCVSLRITWK